MSQKPYEWARAHAATMDDAPSLRTMRRFATENIAEEQKLLAVLEEGDHLRPDCERVIAENQEAIRLIDARMEEIGAPL